MEKIYSILSEFENVTLRKSQWLIIMKAAGCPYSNYLWKVFTDNVLEKSGYYYTLRGLNFELLVQMFNKYKQLNRLSVKKCYYRKHKKVKINIVPKTFVMNPDGSLSLLSNYEKYDR